MLFRSRIKDVIFLSRKYDLIIIEKEIIPFFPPILEYFLKVNHIPYFVDFDDAIFHNYDKNKKKIIRLMLKNKIPYVIKWSKLVIVGSHYLREFASRYNSNILFLPTVVNIYNYKTQLKRTKSNEFIIGWIGSPTTSHYIVSIIEELIRFCSNHNAKINLIGFDRKLLKNKRSGFINFINWNEDSEINELNKISVGIMPLDDSEWAKGKCGFKLIQYMACSKPVVASAVGENNIIIDHGINGYLVKEKKDWYKYLKKIYNNPNLAKQMGEENFRKINNKYSLHVTSEIYKNKIVKFITNKK